MVHEHPRIGSDGESEEGSGTSEEQNISPVSADSNQSNSAELVNKHIYLFSNILKYLIYFLFVV